MPQGTVKRWMEAYGFIISDEPGADLFVHASDLVGGRFLEAGDRVQFEVESTPKGLKALQVRKV